MVLLDFSIVFVAAWVQCMSLNCFAPLRCCAAAPLQSVRARYAFSATAPLHVLVRWLRLRRCAVVRLRLRQCAAAPLRCCYCAAAPLLGSTCAAAPVRH